MSKAHTQMALMDCITNLDEVTTLQIVRQRLEAGDDPLQILKDCQGGLFQVGRQYELGHYYLTGLIMGGEILRQVMQLLEPLVAGSGLDSLSGRVLLGTVQGDIHDLGKGIVRMLLTCRNFAVEDLGVDVEPLWFAERAAEFQPDVIGLSGLLTSSYEAMRETICMLRSAGHRGPIVIGGGQMNDEVCQYVGADHWSNDAITGVAQLEQIIKGQLGCTL